MRVTINAVNFLSMAALFIIGPWFFISQYAPAYSIPIYQIPLSLLLIPFSIMGILWLVKDCYAASFISYLTIAFLLVIVFVALVNSFFDNSNVPTAMMDAIQCCILMTSCYFIGRGVNLESDKNKILIFGCLFLIAAFFIIISVLKGSFFEPSMALSRNLKGSSETGSYQGIARSVTFLFIVLMCTKMESSSRSNLIIWFTIATLAIGSRSFIALGLLFLLRGIRLGYIHTALIIIVSVAFLSEFVAMLEGSRLFDLIQWQSSKSVLGRIELFKETLQVVYGQPLFGKFGYYLRDGFGYSHDIMFTWANFGLVAFMLNVGILAYCSRYFVNYHNSLDPAVKALSLFAIFVVFHLLLTQPILESTLVGLCVGLFNNRKFVKDKN